MNFLQLALAGQCFFGSTTQDGVAIPAYNSTSPVFALWNPAGSGVDLVLNKLTAGVTADGTNAIAALGFSYLANAGAAIGTGAPVSAFTATAPFNARVGEGKASKARFSLSATITAGTFLYALGFNGWAGDIAATALSPTTYNYDFNGSLIIPPGVFIHAVAEATLGLSLQMSLSWAEIPIA